MEGDNKKVRKFWRFCKFDVAYTTDAIELHDEMEILLI